MSLKPKRPYTPPSELPGALWRKATQSTRRWWELGALATLSVVAALALVLWIARPAVPAPALADASPSPANPEMAVAMNAAQSPPLTPTALNTPQVIDQDGDAIDDSADNCPSVANISQVDSDNDGVGDACEDDDNDGLQNTLDNCPALPNPDQADDDGDGIGTLCDERFDLRGISLTTSARLPLALGSRDDSAIILISPEDDSSASTGSFILSASLGTLLESSAECGGGTSSLTVSANVREVRYCAPETSTLDSALLTLREVDANGQNSGRGGALSVGLLQEALTLNFARAEVLNQANEPDPTRWSRCYFPEPVGREALLLEEASLPFTLRLSSGDTVQRRYEARISIPNGAVFLARQEGNACELLTALDPLTLTASFELLTNQDYSLFLVPSTSGEATLNALEIALPRIALTPARVTILPILIPTTTLTARNERGERAESLELGERAKVLGVGGEGTGQWAQIQNDGQENTLWLNIGQLGGSYSLLGNLQAVPTIPLPSTLAN